MLRFQSLFSRLYAKPIVNQLKIFERFGKVLIFGARLGKVLMAFLQTEKCKCSSLLSRKRKCFLEKQIESKRKKGPKRGNTNLWEAE